MFKFFKKSNKIQQNTQQNYEKDIQSPMQFSSLLAFATTLKRDVKFWKSLTFVLFAVGVAAICLCSVKLNNDEPVQANYSKSDFIAEIPIEGMITNNKKFIKILDDISKNNSIKGIVYIINSPGGTITGSEILYDKIKEISKIKPSVSVIEDLGASGAYMASLGTPYIIARNTSLVGSIGVVFEYMDLTSISNKVGFNMKRIKSSDFKAAPNAFEKTTPQVEEYLKDLLNDGYQYFTEVVLANRTISKANLLLALSGKIFTARQAIKIGLIDQIGSKPEALSYLVKGNPLLKNIASREIIIEEEDVSSPFHKLFKGLSSIAQSVTKTNGNKYNLMAVV